jgi:hypothetical protein
MDSNDVTNKAIWEVEHGLGRANTNDLPVALREKYEAERTYQEKLKEEKKEGK